MTARSIQAWCGLLTAIALLVSEPAGAAKAAPTKAAPAPGPAFYVAPNGSDSAAGTKEQPFATLARARDEVRKWKAAGPLSKGGVTIFVRAGLYELTRALQFTAEDSGTAEAPVVYRAYPGEKPILIGGRRITGFEKHQGQILKASVNAQGFEGIYFRQLFFDGKRQHLARYPNFDPQNPYGGGWAYTDGKPVPMYTEIPGETKNSLHYKESDARAWARPEEGEVFVFARYNWWNNIVRIKSVDREKRIITLAGEASYPIRPTDRYYVRNLFEELDAPGEWYLDRQSGTLYFWPPSPLGGKTVYAPTTRTILQLNGTAHVTLQGFTIECCDGTAVVLNKTDNCLVAGNTIRNAGDYNGCGVSVHGGTNNGVAGNDIYEIGSHGITLSGGDRITLTPANNYADNNYIHHIGVFYKQGVGISMSGCGQRASRNLIHDGPRMGIMFSGNNLVIEYNHLRHLNLETEDTGAVYTGGRDWISSRGSVVRYNYFHDILGFGRHNGKWVSPHFAWGVYLDDNTGGVDVIGNIIARCPRAGIHLHNGRDNLMENNIIVDCAPQQLETNGWNDKHSYWVRFLPRMIEGYESVVNQPAWKGMRNMDLHPSKAVLPNGLIMTGNVFRRNIIAYSKPNAKLFRFSRLPFDHYESDYNLIYSGGNPLLVDGIGKLPAEEQWQEWQKLGKDRNSVIADPLFVNAAKEDYRLKPNSPAWKLGFQRIPVEKIGPYKSPLRASWPIVEAEGAREKPIVSEKVDLTAPVAGSPRYEKPVVAPRITRPANAAEPFAGSAPRLTLAVKDTPDRGEITGAPCTATVAHDGETLYVSVTVPCTPDKLRRGKAWTEDDGVEVCFADVSGARPGPTFVLHGFVAGQQEGSADAGATQAATDKLVAATRYTARVAQNGWTGTWAIPLASAGIQARPGLKLAFNIGVHRNEVDAWIQWAGALGATWQVQNAGTLVLE